MPKEMLNKNVQQLFANVERTKLTGKDRDMVALPPPPPLVARV